MVNSSEFGNFVITLMVNNFTNINKMNHYLSPQIIEHKKKTMTYGVINPGTVLGQAQKKWRGYTS
jgi:hypothetical protein